MSEDSRYIVGHLVDQDGLPLFHPYNGAVVDTPIQAQEIAKIARGWNRGRDYRPYRLTELELSDD